MWWWGQFPQHCPGDRQSLPLPPPESGHDRPALNALYWAEVLSRMESAGDRGTSPGCPAPAVPVCASMLLGSRRRWGRSVGRGSPGSQHAGRGQGSACGGAPLSAGGDPAAGFAFQGKEADVRGHISLMSTKLECLQVRTFQNFPSIEQARHFMTFKIVTFAKVRRY